MGNVSWKIRNSKRGEVECYGEVIVVRRPKPKKKQPKQQKED